MEFTSNQKQCVKMTSKMDGSRKIVIDTNEYDFTIRHNNNDITIDLSPKEQTQKEEILTEEEIKANEMSQRRKITNGEFIVREVDGASAIIEVADISCFNVGDYIAMLSYNSKDIDFGLITIIEGLEMVIYNVTGEWTIDSDAPFRCFTYYRDFVPGRDVTAKY